MPSGLNATLDTVSVWPVSGGPIWWPVAASHSRTVLSIPPKTIRCRSALNAAAPFTSSGGPSAIWMTFSRSGSALSRAPSSGAAASRRPATSCWYARTGAPEWAPASIACASDTSPRATASFRWSIASCCFTTAMQAATEAMTVSTARPAIAGAAETTETALLANVIAGQFVLGFAVDRGGQVGDLVAEHRCVRVPRRVGADVDVKRFGGEHPWLGQHRQRRVGPVGVKPSGRFIPAQVTIGHHDQQRLRALAAPASVRPPC